MYKLSPWIITDTHSMRVLLDSDPDVIANRVAFIEKTPRIRIRSDRLGRQHMHYEDGEEYIHRHWPEFLDWAEAPFKGSGPDDQKSMLWCDGMLKAFGYEL